MKNKLLIILSIFLLTSCFKNNNLSDQGNEITPTTVLDVKTEKDSIEIEPALIFPINNFDSVYKEYQLNYSIWKDLNISNKRGLFYRNQYDNIINQGKSILSKKNTQQDLKSEIKILLNKKIAVFQEENNLKYTFTPDTIPPINQLYYDSLISINTNITFDINELSNKNKVIGNELLHKKLVVENAKYYLNITVRNPSQDKFLRGWMNRAFNQ
ncbi:putative peptidoglycan-binding domain-containing protein [Chishuiella sp.]|uniref:putative peptidoglycan-binding domain-containing protein n=1 Tax=Chishuiella sp. TaxID=1969467 RepID=UPI0028A8CD49|nr:putative peptidoglycan-binding domain-containing protein [Chishuiella sp.]